MVMLNGGAQYDDNGSYGGSVGKSGLSGNASYNLDPMYGGYNPWTAHLNPVAGGLVGAGMKYGGSSIGAFDRSWRQPSYGGGYGGGGSTVYNQPYNNNSKSVSVQIPDMFSAVPLSPAAPMNFAGPSMQSAPMLFGQLPSMSPMSAPQQIARAAAPMSAPIPGAVSLGAQALPMAPASANVSRQSGSAANLVPQVAKTDQAPPPVSPVPMDTRQTRPMEMPPVNPRYAPPPQQPYGNPYARPSAPMPPPPMVAPQFDPGQFMPNLQPPSQFYQPAPPRKQGFLANLGRGMQSMAEGLSPNIAATSISRAKARADVQMKMLEMDSQNWRNAADNTRAMMVEMMQQGGQDRRTNYTESNANYRAELQAQAQGRLSQSQGLESLSKGLGLVPQNQADYFQKMQLLQSASQALGQDFTGMINQVSTEGSNAALKQAMEFKKDAMSMLKTQNDLAMQPIENDIKRLQRQAAMTSAANAPLDAASKRLNLVKTAQELKDANDPILREAKRAEAIAKSQDVQRRGNQDMQSQKQHEIQMASTRMSAANQVIMNPFADPKDKSAAAQALHSAQLALNSAALRPSMVGQPLNDMTIVQGYRDMFNGDSQKARSQAEADGWIVPRLPKALASTVGGESLVPSKAGQPLVDLGIMHKYLIANGMNKQKAQAQAEADGWLTPMMPNQSPVLIKSEVSNTTSTGRGPENQYYRANSIAFARQADGSVKKIGDTRYAHANDDGTGVAHSNRGGAVYKSGR